MTKRPPQLVEDEAFDAFYASRPGLIPIQVRRPDNRLIWVDFGAYHIYEGRFQRSVAMSAAMQIVAGAPDEGFQFETSLNVLDRIDPGHDCLPPSGFVFGMSRCGSTLMSRALARHRKVVSYGEIPLASTLSLAGEPEKRPHRLRKLLLLAGRRRRPEYRHVVFKFSTIETLFATQLRAAFPETPCVFMYRDPLEVLVSQRRRPTGWLDYKGTPEGDFFAGCSSHGLSDLAYYDAVLRNTLQAALDQQGPGWAFLNYAEFNAETMPAILSRFGIAASDNELAEIQRCFQTYAKSEYRNRPFRADGEEKRREASTEIENCVAAGLRQLFDQLSVAEEQVLSPRHVARKVS